MGVSYVLKERRDERLRGKSRTMVRGFTQKVNGMIKEVLRKRNLYARVFTLGKSMVNVLPTPGELLTLTVPPCL